MSNLHFIHFNSFDLFPDVMPPDESHYNVNNSVYTNVIAKIAMQAPYKICNFLGLPKDQYKPLKDKADKIYVPFDRPNLYHPEFDGYKLGEEAFFHINMNRSNVL